MKNIILIFCLFFGKILFAQQILFRTNVDNLRLRDEPNLQSKVIKELQKGEILTYLDEKSKTKETITWRGKKVSDYWYKVRYTFSKDSIAWVFGAGIKFDGLDYNDIYTDKFISKHIDNQWIKIDTVSKKEFDKLQIVPMKWKPYKDKFLQDSIGQVLKINYKEFTLKFENGKSKLFKDYEDEFSSSNDNGYIFLGEIVGINYYFLGSYGGDCGYENAVSKSNGKNMGIRAMPYFSPSKKIATPLFAPDKKTTVCELYCEPGGEDGFELVTFEQENSHFIAKFLHLRPRDFRFITNRIFIAKMSDETYIKVTIKKQ